ncbi:DELLA protein RGL2-like [Salvia miltiorrhiza]|uniref:DELLA protein RGL2-like n=1 Tax=Salvia miltiorrhiza TaxID=226208 RepID=UPI0025ACB402|nr:DELLA protein RGL2-like [Salvia miltiorrhiza]
MFDAEKSDFAISQNHQQCVYEDIVSLPCELHDDETRGVTDIEPKSRQNYAFSTEYFEVPMKHGYEMESADDQTSSTEETIRVAAERFIHSIKHPYPSHSLAHCGQNSQGVRLIQSLLSCAEKVADNQYERALKFLKECDVESFSTGTPIQRLAFYFSRALFEKIANETGRIIVKNVEDINLPNPVESVMFPNINLFLSFQKEHPLAQVTKLVGVQAILDHVERNGTIQIIDLEIRSGVQWIILMQDLASRTEHPVQSLRITAVGTKWRSIIQETGRQLAGFARSLNLEFTFETLMVADFSDLNHALFHAHADEPVVVYAPYVLANHVGRVEQLDHLMTVMRTLNPCVMILTELEANCNSPTFVERFVESLFFFGVFFDSLECCFKHDEARRVEVESCWFGSSIKNILAADGEERKFRHVSIKVWRAFFARYGLEEVELSSSSVDQACIGLQSLACGRFCTLYRDGKCLTIGWKGTPLSSVSAWTF